MNFLAIDIEASGQGLQKHFMTQLGAALVAPDGNVLATFEEYLAQPANRDWEPRAVEEFWSKIPQRYSDTLAGVRDAAPGTMTRFIHWVRTVCKDKDVTVVFDTCGFDAAWLDLYLGDINHMYLLGYYKEPFDLTSYMLGCTEEEPGGYSWQAFCACKGLDPNICKSNDVHSPMMDAVVTGKRAAIVMAACWKVV